jgi:hypothetical protein
MPPVKKKIHSYILSKLTNAESEDDLIYSICQETGLNWDEARSLMENEQKEHLAEIKARQLPFRGILCLVFSIVGFVATIGPMAYLWYMLDMTRAIASVLTDGTVSNVNTALMIMGSRCTLMSWFEIPTMFFTSLVGIGIIVANIQYMRDFLTVLFWNWNVSE